MSTLAQAFQAKGYDLNWPDLTEGDEERFVDDLLLRSLPGYVAADMSTSQKMQLARKYAQSEVTDTAPVDAQGFQTGGPGSTMRNPITVKQSGLGGSAPAGGWFAQNAPAASGGGASGGGETAPGGPSFGSYGSFTEQYTTPERPASVSGAFTAPTWNENYTAPTQADLEASPGYLASETAMQRGMERSAAAQGKVLSGGFVGRTLPRALGEHAAGAYQQLRANSFDEYLQRYGQFQGGVNNSLAARGVNEGAYQTDVANAGTQSNTRYGRFMDAAAVKRQAEGDLWSRNLDLSDLSLRAAALARPY